jgi:hypothetical protein
VHGTLVPRPEDRPWQRRVSDGGHLRKAGFDARYMAGVHNAGEALNGPVKLFE